MRAELERRCRDLGLEQRVKFIGFIDQETRLEAYRRAALLVIPSRSEAMSLVALEAGVVGTPVLLTDRCGFDEIAAIGGGMVVRPVPQDIGNGLTALLSRMDELPAMGERLRRMIRETYSWPAVANRLRAHLESLIA
jgi:glycosyltransferase involved in cell wall biosynthesis